MLMNRPLLLVAILCITTSVIVFSISKKNQPLNGHSELPIDTYVKLSYSVEYTPNPTDALSTAQHSYNLLVYRRLFKFDKLLAIKPDLAQEWVFDKAKNELTVKIDRNVVFSDGSLLTITDVVSSLKYLKNQSANRSNYSMIKSLRASDPDTLIVGFKDRITEIVPLLAAPVAVIYKNEMPSVGSGPFKLVSRERDTLTLKNSKGPLSPDIKVLKIQAVEESQAQMLVSSGKAHDMIDILINTPIQNLSGTKAQMYSVSTNYTWLISMNQGLAPFNSVEQRRCLNTVFDRIKFVETLVPSHTVAKSYIPQITALPERAGANESSCRRSIGHRKFQMTEILVPIEIADTEKICSFLSKQFQKAGLNPNCKVVPFDQILNAIKSKTWSAALLGIGMEVPTAGYMLKFLNSAGDLDLLNKSHASIDTLISEYEKSEDRREQSQILAAANEIINRDALVIAISHPKHQTLVNKCLINLELSPLGSSYTDYSNVRWSSNCNPIVP
jgi:ABC-type transport system substrate-binding protein